MTDYNPADIPATLEFQKEVLLLQEEYRTALKDGIYPDKSFDKMYFLNYMYFTEKCHYIYISKISTLIDKIVEKHKKSNLSHIDLNNYKRFIELVTETGSNLHDILENK
jgi:hypothetical protein